MTSQKLSSPFLSSKYQYFLTFDSLLQSAIGLVCYCKQLSVHQCFKCLFTSSNYGNVSISFYNTLYFVPPVLLVLLLFQNVILMEI